MSMAASTSPEGLVGTVASLHQRERSPDHPVVRVAWPAMANKPTKRKVSGGRVTPKGGPDARRSGDVPDASSRYTPPVPREMKVSPRWVPVLMFGLLGVGLLVIFVNYLGVLPGGTDNRWLIAGLVAILGGIITATQYH
jgi:hypothetical protein